MPQTVSSPIEFLQSVELFAGLNPDLVNSLAKDFHRRTYRKGDIIFHQGDASRQLLLIVHGKIRVYHLSASAKETTVNILVPRQLLGEFALVDGQPRTATAEAISECTVLEMHSTTAMHHLSTVPELTLSMCRQIVKKMRWTTMYAETIAQLDAPGRLLHFLLLYKDQIGHEIALNQYQIELGLTQTDLATLIGVDRQWVNKVLNDWKKRDLVSFARGIITILDLPQFQDEMNRRLC